MELRIRLHPNDLNDPYEPPSYVFIGFSDSDY